MIIFYYKTAFDGLLILWLSPVPRPSPLSSAHTHPQKKKDFHIMIPRIPLLSLYVH